MGSLIAILEKTAEFIWISNNFNFKQLKILTFIGINFIYLKLLHKTK